MQEWFEFTHRQELLGEGHLNSFEWFFSICKVTLWIMQIYPYFLQSFQSNHYEILNSFFNKMEKS